MKQTVPSETLPPKTFLDRVKSVSLSAAGIGFILGDAAFFAADRLNNDKTGSMAGLVYMLGAIIPVKYGKENPHYQLTEMHRRLREYLVSEHVTIPEGTALNRDELVKPKGLVDQVEGFFRRYPSEIYSGIGALGGSFKLASALHKNEVKYSTLAYGGLGILAGLVGMLVPEKLPDPIHPPTTTWGSIKEKVQAHPLRIASSIFMINSGNLLLGAVEQRKEHLLYGTKPGYKLTFLTACVYIMSNGLMAITSKNRDVPTYVDKHFISALEKAATEVIAAQPVQLRDALIDHVADYLSMQPHVVQTAPQLAEEMHQLLRVHIEEAKLHQTDWKHRREVSALPVAPSGRM